jgi:hypothetical protein
MTSYQPAPAPSYYNNQQQQMLNYSSNTYAPKTNYLAYAPTSNNYSKTYAPMDYSKYYADNSRKYNFQNYQSYVDNSYVSNSYVYKPHYSNYSSSLKINPSKPQAYSTAYAQGTDSYFPKGANHIGEYGGGTGTYATGYGDATPYNASPSYGGEYGKPNCHKGYHHPHGGYGGSSYGGGYGSTAYGAGSNALDIVKQLYPNGLMDPNTFFNS